MGELSIFSEKDSLVKIHAVALKKLIVQSAAEIINACDSHNPVKIKFPNSKTAKILAKDLQWSFRGFVDGLATKADLILAYVKAIVDAEGESKLATALKQREVILIREALERFQKWKTEYCEENRRIHGKEWAKGVELYNKDWTELNKKFSALFWK